MYWCLSFLFFTHWKTSAFVLIFVWCIKVFWKSGSVSSLFHIRCTITNSSRQTHIILSNLLTPGIQWLLTLNVIFRAELRKYSNSTKLVNTLSWVTNRSHTSTSSTSTPNPQDILTCLSPLQISYDSLSPYHDFKKTAQKRLHLQNSALRYHFSQKKQFIQLTQKEKKKIFGKKRQL